MNDKHFLMLEWHDPLTHVPMQGYMPLPVIIGRGNHASLKIEDDAISRQHAMIALTDYGLVLRDLSSTNGTYLNGRAVFFGYLNAGDRIMAGAVVFRVDGVAQEQILKSALIIKHSLMEDLTTVLIRRN